MCYVVFQNRSLSVISTRRATRMSLTGTGNDATAVNSPFGCSEISLSGSYYGCSSKNISTRLCIKCDSSSEISYLDRVRYCDSLVSLEREDSEWISDSNPYGCSSENPSTPLSTKFDSSSVISDLDRTSYWDSSLNLEGEDREWISDSAPELECFWDGFPSTYYKSSWGTAVLPSVCTVSSFTDVHCNISEDNVSAEHLLEIADLEEFSADGLLFWSFEGKYNWNSEESWSSFSISPRRRLVFGSRSTTSRTKESKQKGDEDVCSVKSESSKISTSSKSSAKIVTLECKDEIFVLKRGGVASTSNKLLSLDQTF